MRYLLIKTQNLNLKTSAIPKVKYEKSYAFKLKNRMQNYDQVLYHLFLFFLFLISRREALREKIFSG